MENEEKNTLLKRIISVIGYRDTGVLDDEARQIQALLDAMDQDGRAFLDTPEQISGLSPQCLGGKIKARLSSYCAVRALKELAKNPPSMMPGEEWTGAAEECAKLELNDYFTGSARQSNVASQKRAKDHDEIYQYWNKLVSGGASIGDANKRTAEIYGISVRQVQIIRSKKTKLAG